MRFSPRSSGLAAAFSVCVWLSPAALAANHGTSGGGAQVPAALAVRKELRAPPRGVSDLKFRDMFKLPVGPRGLEPSATLSALDGKRVRMVGYMVQQEPLPMASFLLAPLPVQISDEDEPLADDLPPSTISVVVAGAEAKAIRSLPGLIQVTGVLHVGARTDAGTGRVSSAQIALDAPLARWLIAPDAPTTHAAPARSAQTRATH